MAGLSFLRVVSNDTLVKQEEAHLAREMEARQNLSYVTELAGYVRRCWDAAKLAKGPITDRMLRALQQRNGVYESARLQAIRAQGGSEIYMMLTEIKCRAAESWLRDILLDDGAPPWDLKATPLPDLAPAQTEEVHEIFASRIFDMVQQSGRAPSAEEARQLREVIGQDLRFALLQEAQNRADRMKLRIEDQFVEGHFGEAFNEVLSDLTTFPCAFVKGPIVRRQRTLGWVQGETGTEVSVTERLAPEYERVDPFSIYPEPGITRINDGYLIEVHRLTRTTLSDLIGVPEYDEDIIRKILETGSSGSWLDDTGRSQQEEAEGKYHADASPTDEYEALEFWGKVSGKMLRDWGMDESEVDDLAREYDANVWVVGSYVIKAVLNYDPLGEKPYAKSSFIKMPGAFWGRGIPEILEDLQHVCNAAARALVNNMGIASGPQVEVNIERLPPNEDLTNIVPWKIWQTINDPVGSSAPAIRFTQPDSNASELMAVYERFSQLADDHSGVPSYVYGNLDVQGAGRTSSGLSMLMGAAGKGIRQVVMHIDNDIIRPIVRRQFIYNMRYDEDESIKGDVEIVARGATTLAVKETVNVRRLEFLNATANPLDSQIIGLDGRAAILREVARGLQMPVDDIVPSRDRLSMQAAQAGAAQDAPQQPEVVQPDGSQKGGYAGNIVSNRDTGAA
jgi:hypothetical protein